MKRIAKWIFGLVILILLTPIVCFLIYAGTVFLPVKSDIDQIIASAGYEDSNSPENIRSLIRASVNTDRKPSWVVARLLVPKYRTNDRGYVQNWQLQWAVWTALVDMVYDDGAVYALFCTLIYTGDGNGLNELSGRMFGKPLSGLTLDEAAQVIAFTRAPNIYKKDIARLQTVKLILLKKVSQ
jgi:hypothetical protein